MIQAIKWWFSGMTKADCLVYGIFFGCTLASLIIAVAVTIAARSVSMKDQAKIIQGQRGMRERK